MSELGDESGNRLSASRPFQQLQSTDGSPKLPHGYLRMALLVLFWNREAQRLMTAELSRKRLGPFRPSAT